MVVGKDTIMRNKLNAVATSCTSLVKSRRCIHTSISSAQLTPQPAFNEQEAVHPNTLLQKQEVFLLLTTSIGWWVIIPAFKIEANVRDPDVLDPCQESHWCCKPAYDCVRCRAGHDDGQKPQVDTQILRTRSCVATLRSWDVQESIGPADNPELPRRPAVASRVCEECVKDQERLQPQVKPVWRRFWAIHRWWGIALASSWSSAASSSAVAFRARYSATNKPSKPD